MIQYLRVKNWETHQHYKDRSPPWIKLHREVLDDYELSCLQDASKLHLILIWVLSSQLNNRIPNDPEWVAKKIGAASKVNLKELIDKGFLILEQSASSPLAECSPERETEGETETDKKIYTKKFKNDFEELWEIFPTQRKGNRQKAEVAYRQALTRSSHAEILEGLKSYTDSDEVKQGFAKGMAAWLNDDRWKTEYESSKNDNELAVSRIVITPDMEDKNIKFYLKNGIQHPVYNPEGLRKNA